MAVLRIASAFVLAVSSLTLVAACGGEPETSTATAQAATPAGVPGPFPPSATASIPGRPTSAATASATGQASGTAKPVTTTSSPAAVASNVPGGSDEATAATRPFPQHVSYTAGTITPNTVSEAAMDASVIAHYNAWKTNYLRNTGGQGIWVKYDDTDTTVSEALGYGMVLAAYMADRTTFDSMFNYFTTHYSGAGPHLMSWKQTLSGGVMKNIEGNDSATDGDLDIAYALILAHVQWGSAGTIDYEARALEVMHDILAYEVNRTHWNLTPGDWAADSDADHTRPSDFMTGHLLAFAKYDTANATKWNNVYDAVVNAVNDQFANGSGATGLMPDFMVRSGANWVPTPGTYLETTHDGDFSYNACRTPWRLAMSYLNNGRTEMLAPLQKMASWIRVKAAGVPTNIRAGYYVRNGTNGRTFVNFDDLAFTAPMAINAMVGGSAAQPWLNNLWQSITGGDYSTHVGYFGDAIRMHVLITVSGNWWAP